MKSIIRTAALALTAVFAFTTAPQAAVMTLDGLGNPISVSYHDESQTYTGANTFATFDDVGIIGSTPVWTWDVSVTQTGTTGEMQITGNIQVPNIGGHHRGFSLTLDGGIDFVSALIIDAADFTGFISPFVTVTSNTLTFVAPNFGAPAVDLHATIQFTTTTTVPGPGALALLGFGMIGVVAAKQRKQ